jgi:hypothetical protein
MSMERLKNAALVFCLFIVLVVIFSSYFRASEVGTFFGALAGTPPPGPRFQSTCSQEGHAGPTKGLNAANGRSTGI